VSHAAALREPPQAANSTKPLSTASWRDLLALLRDTSGLSAHFIEEKTMALLALPLVSEGDLYFVQQSSLGPRALVRHTTSPVASSLLLEGTNLRMGTAGSYQSIDLKSQPVVRLFVDSFVEIFAGDEHAIASLYHVEFAGTLDDWYLKLVPRPESVRKVIAQIRVRGQQAQVSQVEMLEANGDLTTTRFVDAQHNRKFSGKERAEIFRLLPALKVEKAGAAKSNHH
jgi:hypothetical protein